MTFEVKFYIRKDFSKIILKCFLMFIIVFLQKKKFPLHILYKCNNIEDNITNSTSSLGFEKIVQNHNYLFPQ